MHRKAETRLKMYRVSRILIFVYGKSIDVNHRKNISDDDLFLSLIVWILFRKQREQMPKAKQKKYNHTEKAS